MPDMRMIDAGPPPPLCDVTDPSLVWCLEFDEPGLATATTTLDGAGQHNDPAISGINVVTRNVPANSQAIALTTSSSISIAKPGTFDLQAYTLTAWVYRSSNSELGVIDTSHQYTMSISSTDRTVECSASNQMGTIGTLSSLSGTGANEWDLIACTFDGQHLCSYSLRNGSTTASGGCGNFNQTLATFGGTTTVGEWATGTSHFVGQIDQVRIYNRVLSATEICQNGGLSGC